MLATILAVALLIQPAAAPTTRSAASPWALRAGAPREIQRVIDAQPHLIDAEVDRLSKRAKSLPTEISAARREGVRNRMEREAKAERLRKLQAELDSLPATIAATARGQRLIIPAYQESGELGFGSLVGNLVVVQVQGPRDALVKIAPVPLGGKGFETDQDTTRIVWLSNIDTSTWSDGKQYPPPINMLAADPKSYTAVSGGRRTVDHFIAFSADDIAAAPH